MRLAFHCRVFVRSFILELASLAAELMDRGEVCFLRIVCLAKRQSDWEKYIVVLSIMKVASDRLSRNCRIRQGAGRDRVQYGWGKLNGNRVGADYTRRFYMRC